MDEIQWVHNSINEYSNGYHLNGYSNDHGHNKSRGGGENKKYKRQHYQPQYIEFNLSGININEYKESAEIGINDYKLRFRYKYLEEGISIFLNENKGKIYIPLEALEDISKVHLNLIILTLKENAIGLISYSSREIFINDDPIRENLTTTIHVYAQDSTPQQAIDMTGLHINYIVNKNKTKIHNEIQAYHMIDEELLIKCHLADEIRILCFNSQELLEDIKYTIMNVLGISEISKIRYKDDDGTGTVLV
ncbi:2874_t:CDS:2 [Diversispora eburnea]|uniref:2874_t:CDS:1 n=1 Tax=Diversispora eburnea TaxID=1213867 RepID=A0A9N9BQN7_9GLOM|nr:2874_t:CDS:2 [Diversispora eburnea]